MMSEVRDITFTGCNVADIEVGHHDIQYIQTPDLDLFFFPDGPGPPGRRPPLKGPCGAHVPHHTSIHAYTTYQGLWQECAVCVIMKEQL